MRKLDQVLQIIISNDQGEMRDTLQDNSIRLNLHIDVIIGVLEKWQECNTLLWKLLKYWFVNNFSRVVHLNKCQQISALGFRLITCQVMTLYKFVSYIILFRMYFYCSSIWWRSWSCRCRRCCLKCEAEHSRAIDKDKYTNAIKSRMIRFVWLITTKYIT